MIRLEAMLVLKEGDTCIPLEGRSSRDHRVSQIERDLWVQKVQGSGQGTARLGEEKDEQCSACQALPKHAGSAEP
jgi:hypothetical protein